MQNAALSTLTVFQALTITENTRGPKITKVCRFPPAQHLNAAATDSATKFNTHDACRECPRCGPSCRRTAKSHLHALFFVSRLVLQDHPAPTAPWHIDLPGSAESAAKRLRATQSELVAPAPAAATGAVAGGLSFASNMSGGFLPPTGALSAADLVWFKAILCFQCASLLGGFSLFASRG